MSAKVLKNEVFPFSYDVVHVLYIFDGIYLYFRPFLRHDKQKKNATLSLDLKFYSK